VFDDLDEPERLKLTQRTGDGFTTDTILLELAKVTTNLPLSLPP